MGEDVDRWLESLGLGKYAALFAENEITVDVVPRLTEADLKELGLPLGPRRVLLDAIQNLTAAKPAADASPTDRPAAPAAAETNKGQAERRQLTVMFVDLAGSTALAERLDPEDMGAVLRAYQNAVAGEIARFEGHVAKFMGDGVLAYFGWPVAHEDEAERAVRSGLALVEAVVKLRDGEAPLACRVGIATGLVVVGELLGEGAAKEETVVGETPNLAARLQALAEPGQVVIAETTRRLAGAAFELVTLETQHLKGISAPVTAFKVLGERTADSRFDARSGAAVMPMVGRDQELALLLGRWSKAKAGEGQGVLLVGEAGIGKSRISRALLDALAGEPHIRVRFQCSPYHNDSAFWPVIQHLRRAAGLGADQTPDEQLDKLESVLGRKPAASTTVVAPMAALLGLAGEARYGPLALSPQALRGRILACLADQIDGLAALRPVLWIVEDAHWLDPSTLELIELCLDRLAKVPLLVVLTSRPDHQPLLAAHPQITRLTLNRLGRAGVESIVNRLCSGTVLPVDVVDAILERTDGVPLFVEELTKAIIESGDTSVPASLQDSLMARLDRIPEVKQVVQIAAVIGRVFDHRTIAALSAMPTTKLDGVMQRLAQAELVFCRGRPPDVICAFKHALVRDAAYESLLKSRRQALHARLVDVLAADTGAAPEVLAHHALEAGLLAKAADFWLEAGRNAMRRSANVEAERHLRKGLAVLEALPEDAGRRRREITLQNTLGVCLMPTRGFGNPDVAGAFSRAASIAEQEGDTRGLFVALRGEGQYQMISGGLLTAREQAFRILGLADELDDPGILLEAHHLCWSALAFTGDFVAARDHAEVGVALYDRDRDHHLIHVYSGHDPGVCCRSFGSLALWQLGFPDQALAMCRDGEQLARNVNHPFTVTIALWAAGIMHLLRRETAATLATGDAMMAHCREHGFPPFIPMGRIFRGGALVEQGAVAEGIEELTSGIEGVRASGTQYTVPLFFAWLGELCGKAGLLDGAATALAEGLSMAEATGDQFSRPEFDRVNGVVLMARSASHQPAAEACIELAIQRARSRDARSLELRASRDLARLLAERGERQRALDLLAPVYDWFTEGFDTPDLIEAKQLLDEVR